MVGLLGQNLMTHTEASLDKYASCNYVQLSSSTQAIDISLNLDTLENNIV